MFRTLLVTFENVCEYVEPSVINTVVHVSYQIYLLHGSAVDTTSKPQCNNG